MIDTDNNNDELRQRLTRLKDFLQKQSLFAQDNLSWAAECLTKYLDKKSKSLDHAFGLRSSKRGPKPMTSGVHDNWVASALLDVGKATPKGKEWPNTKDLAKIGRQYGLGGNDSLNLEDHAIASGLKTILKRYRPIIIKQLSEELNTKFKARKESR